MSCKLNVYANGSFVDSINADKLEVKLQYVYA